MRTMTKLSTFSHGASGKLRQPLAAHVLGIPRIIATLAISLAGYKLKEHLWLAPLNLNSDATIVVDCSYRIPLTLCILAVSKDPRPEHTMLSMHSVGQNCN